MSERKVYVVMWQAQGKAWFATATVKKLAMAAARRLEGTVYPIPYPGRGWDCPTIRATFDPIYVPAVQS